MANDKGKLFAFCEGRRSLWDDGNIDLVMKTSLDNGKTWSALKVIWDDGEHTCGNPVPVFDPVSKQILIVATLNNDKVYLLSANENGEEWNMPFNITGQVKPDNWEWYATGPVHGLVMKYDRFKNRIVIPCNHTVKNDPKHRSHVIYSDNSGESWKIGGADGSVDTDECTVAELNNGNLLLNMRTNNNENSTRKLSFSQDGGNTWTEAKNEDNLWEPSCQGAMLSHPDSSGIIFFVNPRHQRKRKNLTLSISTDNGATWRHRICVLARKSAYSDMVFLPNGDLLIIFETGKLLPYGGIFSRTISATELFKW